MSDRQSNEVVNEVIANDSADQEIGELLSSLNAGQMPSDSAEFGGEMVSPPLSYRSRAPKRADPQRMFKKSDAFREHRFVEKGMIVLWYETGQRDVKPYSALVIDKFEKPACLTLKIFDYSETRMIYASVDGCRHVDDPSSEPEKLATGGWCLPPYLLKIAYLLEQNNV